MSPFIDEKGQVLDLPFVDACERLKPEARSREPEVALLPLRPVAFALALGGALHAESLAVRHDRRHHVAAFDAVSIRRDADGDLDAHLDHAVAIAGAIQV